MRALLLLIAVVGCKSSPSPAPPAPPAAPVNDMDEKMRHCPLALDGAVSTLSDIDGGVRFTVVAPPAQVGEARRRAHHVVDFAARRTREGHSGFDAKGGGHMRNCPVVTDDVTITAGDTEGGAQLDVITTPEHVDALRAETRERAQRFPFVGASIRQGAQP